MGSIVCKINPKFKTLYFSSNDKTPDDVNILREFFPNIIHSFDKKENIEQCMSENRIDLILVDLDKSFEEGLRILKKIRKIDKLVLILVLSPYSEKEHLLKTIEIGICNYLIKPITTPQINEACKALFEYNYNNETIIKLKNDYIWDTTTF